MKDDRGKAFALRFRATSFKHKGKFKIAIEYFQDCLKLFNKQENKWQIAITLNEIAEIHQEKNEINHAIENYLLMLNIVKELEKVIIETNILAHLVELYLKINETKKAEDCLLQLEKLSIDSKQDSIKEQYSNAKEMFIKKRRT